MSFLEDYEGPLTLIVIALLGRLLAFKIHAVQHIVGFQQVIMSCFLPSLLLRSITALPVSELSTSWRYPVFALVYSCFLMICVRMVFWLTSCVKVQQERDTLLLMFPGLAPGLTSMPYVSAVVAEMQPKTINSGQVGLADLGIKFFVLFVLFVLALRMSQNTQKRKSARATQRVQLLNSGNFWQSLRKLCHGFLTEPVNFASCLGVVLLSLGPIRLEDASIVGRAIEQISRCCTPALFLLIGMKVKLFQTKQGVLLILMLFRSGLGLLFSYLLSIVFQAEPNETMFWVFLCSSSLSFWPYTHICKIGEQEESVPHMMCKALLEEAAQDDHLSQDIRSFLSQLGDNLQDGTSNVTNIVEQVNIVVRGTHINGSASFALASIDAVTSPCESKSLIKSCNVEDESTETPNSTAERLHELELDLEKASQGISTFDPVLALMALSVSTSWTFLSCTILALTPTDFWIAPHSLPAVGGTMVFVSVLGLKWLGWHLTDTSASSNLQEAEKETPDDMNRLTIATAAPRKTIVPAEARLGALEVCEAHFELESTTSQPTLLSRLSQWGSPPSHISQESGFKPQADTRCNSVLNYGLRKSMARLREYDIQEGNRRLLMSTYDQDMFGGQRDSAMLAERSTRAAQSGIMGDRSSTVETSNRVEISLLEGVKEETIDVFGTLPPSHWRKQMQIDGWLDLQTVKKDLEATEAACSFDCSDSLRQSAKSSAGDNSSSDAVVAVGSLSLEDPPTLLGRVAYNAEMDLCDPSQCKKTLIVSF